MEDWADAIEDEYDEEMGDKADYIWVKSLLFNYPNSLVDEDKYFV